MKESPRARRLKRHQRRTSTQGKLNLVSLMDIFTILVFFLMVNSSSDVDLMKESSGITLPESTAEQKPNREAALVVTAEDVLLNGTLVMKRADLEAQDTAVAPALREALAALDAPGGDAAGEISRSDTGAAAGWPVTILADQELPYQLLRKLMASCTEAGYSRISLAVTQATPEEV